MRCGEETYAVDFLFWKSSFSTEKNRAVRQHFHSHKRVKKLLIRCIAVWWLAVTWCIMKRRKRNEWYGELGEPDYFRQVKTDGFTVVWPHGQDICPDELYDLSTEIWKRRFPQYLVLCTGPVHTTELDGFASAKPPKFHSKLCAFCEKFFWTFFKKILANPGTFLYNNHCCDIDSCEAWGCCLRMAGFPWSECQVMKLATSHCTK